MTHLSAIADCILSGQVPDAEIVRLRAENPGLGWVLEHRSRAAPLAHAGQTGQGGVSVSPSAQPSCSVDPFNLDSQPALARGAGQEEGRDPLKARSLLSQFVSSLHSNSFLPRKLWRQ